MTTPSGRTTNPTTIRKTAHDGSSPSAVSVPPRSSSLPSSSCAAAVVALAEGGQHVFQLNPLADGVGKHAFEPSARDEADFTPVPDQQDAQPVVVLGAPHAPLRKEIDGEIEDVAARNVVHGHHGHLSNRPVAERPADRVDTRYGAGRKDTVGIRHVARTVGALDIGDILGAVAPGLRRKARKEQQAKNDKASHIHRQK